MLEIEKMFKEHSNSKHSGGYMHEEFLAPFLIQVATYLVQEKILPKENNFLTMENIVPVIKNNAGKIRYIFCFLKKIDSTKIIIIIKFHV